MAQAKFKCLGDLPLIGLGFEQWLQIACAVEHTDDLDSAQAWQVENDVSFDREAAQVGQQFGSLASHPGLEGEGSKFSMDAGSEGIGLTDAVVGNVRPNFREVGRGLGAYDNG
jgi:hypothetical protein